MAGAIKITCIGCAVLKPVLAELAEMPLSWLQGPFCELTVGLQQKRLSNQAITAEIRISHLKPVLFLHFCYVWSCYVSLKILNHFLSLCIEIDWILDAVKTITSAQIYLHNSLLIFGNQVQALSYPWWKAIGYKQVVTSMQLDGWGNKCLLVRKWPSPVSIPGPCRTVKRFVVTMPRTLLLNSVPKRILVFYLWAAVLYIQDLSLHLLHPPKFNTCRAVLRMWSCSSYCTAEYTQTLGDVCNMAFIPFGYFQNN